MQDFANDVETEIKLIDSEKITKDTVKNIKGISRNNSSRRIWKQRNRRKNRNNKICKRKTKYHFWEFV